MKTAQLIELYLIRVQFKFAAAKLDLANNIDALLQMNVGDHSGNQWVSMFNDECEKVLGLSAQAAGELMEANTDAFTDVVDQAQFREFILKCRVKMETYNVSICDLLGSTVLLKFYSEL